MGVQGDEYPQSFYGLLAILSIGSQTGYDIRKELEKPEIFYWKESYGNIYPMLRKLEKDGLVSRKDSYVKRKKRVVYQLNPRGTEALRNWLLQPATLSRFRVEILMKLRFGEIAGIPNMIDQVRVYRETALRELAEARDFVDSMQMGERTLSADLQIIAADYLCKLKESNVKWCDAALKTLSEWESGEALPSDDLTGNSAEESVFQVPRKRPPLIE